MNIDIAELPTMIAQLLDNSLEAAIDGLEVAVRSLEAAIHILSQLLEATVGVLTHGSHLVEKRHKLLSKEMPPAS
jgi:hypothetical protein